MGGRRAEAVLADRVAPDARVDTMLLTVLPGESATIAVTTGADVPRAALLDPLVLRSVNQLLAPTPGPPALQEPAQLPDDPLGGLVLAGVQQSPGEAVLPVRPGQDAQLAEHALGDHAVLVLAEQLLELLA